MIKKLTLIFIGLLYTSLSFAQLDNNMQRYSIPMNVADTQRLMLAFSNFNFMRNYEYFNPIESGFTLFGYELNPRLAYMPGKYLRLEAGIFVRKDFGNDKYTIVQPTLTAKVSKNGYSFLIGNTEGTLNHRLVEPIYDFDNIINYPLENGAQFLIDKKRIWNDVWIDWEKAIYPGSTYQEQLWTGVSSRITVAGANKNLKLIVPLQAVLLHRGGQIEVEDSTTHISLIQNFAAGLILKWNSPSKQSFVQELKTENYWVYYHNSSPVSLTPFNSGGATYLNASIRTKYFIEAMITYWNGDNFIAPRGAPLYESISTNFDVDHYIEKNRQLLYFRLMYEQQWLPNFYVGFRFEPYYDLNNKLLEYSYHFFTTYRKDFSLAKVRRKEQ